MLIKLHLKSPGDWWEFLHVGGNLREKSAGPTLIAYYEADSIPSREGWEGRGEQPGEGDTYRQRF